MEAPKLLIRVKLNIDKRYCTQLTFFVEVTSFNYISALGTDHHFSHWFDLQ